jgi:N-methylhydantoinase A
VSYRIGIDIGGTFTDFVVVRDDEVVLTWKEESTPWDATVAVDAGLEAIAAQLRTTLSAFLGETTLLVHGTTTAMNTVIERAGPRVGLACTAGFRDVLYFRNGFKPDRFNIRLRHPRPLVPRWLRLPITERIGAHGEIVTPLDEDSVRRAAAQFRAAEVEAVAVALLWAPVNRTHERRVAEILREELPGIPVVEATDVLPEIREWERTSAAAISAYVHPAMSRYLGRLERHLLDAGLGQGPLIMQTNGGCASVAEILQRPVYSLASGPAAAPAAAIQVAGAESRDLIAMDLGGTSFDVSLITDGRPALTRTMEIEGQPIGVTAVAVHSIGAGGGSIAWVDEGGVMRIGPQSAGSRPGPACYDLGGQAATLTDAYVSLGHLDPGAFLGGRRHLREDLALEAIERDVAAPLGLDAVHAAAGIKRVIDARMVRAIQAVSVKRGIDPRRYTLVAGGGAGGLHAVGLARQLQMPRVVAPRQAAVLCALGMTVTDVRHDYARMLRVGAEEADLDELSGLFGAMEDDGRGRLHAEGFGDVHIQMERSVDACYRGQMYELTVPLSGASRLTREALDEASAAFHARHQVLFGYQRADLPVHFLHWRLIARGRVVPAAAKADRTAGGAGPQPEPASQRLLHFLELGGWILTDIHDAERLVAGSAVEGPAVIQSPATMLLLMPGDRATVRADGSFVIDVAAAVHAPAPAATGSHSDAEPADRRSDA